MTAPVILPWGAGVGGISGVALVREPDMVAEATTPAEGRSPIQVVVWGELVETAPSVTTTLLPITATTPPWRGAGSGFRMVQASDSGLYSTTLLVELKLSVCPPAKTIRPLWTNVPASMCDLANGMLAFWDQM